jgi:hypothetical protein
VEPFLEHSGFFEADFVAYVGNRIQRRGGGEPTPLVPPPGEKPPLGSR